MIRLSRLVRNGLLLGILILTTTSIALAHDAPAPSIVRQTQPAPNRPAPTDLNPSSVSASAVDTKHPKLESSLVAAGRTARAGNVRGALAQASERGAKVVGTQVRVIVEAAGGSTAGAKSAIVAAGGTVEAEYEHLIQALLPPGSIETVANDPSVSYVRPPAAATRMAVPGEGVGASGATGWQTAGITGSGVKVGVIDFGFTGYPQRQVSGDLPANLVAVDFCNGQVTTAGGDHGTAVAEIVYEMAPGIQLYLLCVGTEVQLGLAKDYAKANGIHILSSSIGFAEHSRGDGSGAPGTPVTTVADAFDNGILWVQAAGNSAQRHWSGNFTDSDADNFHEFSPGDEEQTLYISNGQRACFSLKWDSWPTTSQDFDMELRRFSDLVLVEFSYRTQDGTQSPTEFFCYTNTGSSQYFSLIIRKFQATQSPRFDLFVVNSSVELEYLVAAGSVDEMAASPKALAVGAICWQSNLLEPYSSQGPTIDGRVKPDIAGQSVVSSASKGSFSSCTNSGVPGHGFNGTSAAQPHVAGAAALVKQANPSFTPAQIQAFLESRAVDQGASGKDNQFGAGRLALGTPPTTGPTGADLAVSLTDSPDPVPLGQTVTFTVSIVNHGPQTATGANATVTLPTAFTFQSSTCPGSQSGPSCNGLTLSNGQTLQYQVVAVSGSPGVATATVSVSSGVSDPNAANNSATQLTTVHAGTACSPRPRVRVSTSVANGRLEVTLSATGSGQLLQSVRFGTDARAPVNALLDLPDGRTGLTDGVTVALAPASPSYSFAVRRGAPGQSTTVPIVVTDNCGTWETFVGGGTGAGF